MPLPTGDAKKWTANLLVAEHIQNCVGFLGQSNDRGDFIPHGTAFFAGLVAYQRTIPYIVTAKHVLDQIPGDFVVLRVNTISNSGVRYIRLPRSDWYFHPLHDEKKNYIDVAVCKTKFDYTDIDMTFFTMGDFLDDGKRKQFSVGTGDEVVITGLFHSHIGRLRNIPVVRIGNIAAMPAERLPTDKGMMEGILVESRSIGGVSGSPVFTHLAVRPEKTMVPGQPYPRLDEKPLNKPPFAHYLLGLVHGYYTINAQDEWVSKTTQQAGDMNTGITLVVPVSKIAETIDQEMVSGNDIKELGELDAEMRRRSGVKSASVPSLSAEVHADGNPDHREDFTSLLNAAAKTKPQVD